MNDAERSRRRRINKIILSITGGLLGLVALLIVVGSIVGNPDSQEKAASAPVEQPSVPDSIRAQQGPHQVESTDIRCSNQKTIESLHTAAEEGEWERYDNLLQSSNCSRMFEREVVHGPFATMKIGEGPMELTYQLHELSDGDRFWFVGSSVTPVKGGQPKHVYSSESITLLGLYRELEEFRHDPDFHRYCYATGGPYNSWSESVLALHHSQKGLTILEDTGIFAFDLWNLGWEYCQNQGKETRNSKEITDRMHPGWLAQPGEASSVVDENSSEQTLQQPAGEVTIDEMKALCRELGEALSAANEAGLSGDQVQASFADEGVSPEELAELVATCNVVMNQK